MAYVPTVWVDGGPPAINAANLNKIESGLTGLASAVDMEGVVTPATLTITDLQTAADSAAVSGAKLVASGSITTDQTLVLRSDADLRGLSITYTGTGVAVQVGNGTDALKNKTITLPTVLCYGHITGGGWAAGTIGVLVVNADTCTITQISATNFETGLKLLGAGKGTAYCTINLGFLYNNKRNLVLSTDATGWSNQNLFMGGRLAYLSSEGTSVAGTAQIVLEDSASSKPNNNTFINVSVEGNVPEWHLDCSGVNNVFINTRFEASTGARVRWANSASSNTILNGYYADTITETHGAATLRNVVLGNAAWKIRGGYPGREIQLDVIGSSPSIKISGATKPAILLDAVGASQVLAVMGADGISDKRNTTTDYVLSVTPLAVKLKRVTDVTERLQLDAVNGRIYFGRGVIAPAAYLGPFADSGIAVSEGDLAFGVDGTNDIGWPANYRPRDIHAARYVRVGSIYLRDNAGTLEKSTDATTWSAV